MDGASNRRMWVGRGANGDAEFHSVGKNMPERAREKPLFCPSAWYGLCVKRNWYNPAKELSMKRSLFGLASATVLAGAIVAAQAQNPPPPPPPSSPAPQTT